MDANDQPRNDQELPKEWLEMQRKPLAKTVMFCSMLVNARNWMTTWPHDPSDPMQFQCWPSALRRMAAFVEIHPHTQCNRTNKCKGLIKRRTRNGVSSVSHAQSKAKTSSLRSAVRHSHTLLFHVLRPWLRSNTIHTISSQAHDSFARWMNTRADNDADQAPRIGGHAFCSELPVELLRYIYAMTLYKEILVAIISCFTEWLVSQGW